MDNHSTYGSTALNSQRVNNSTSDKASRWHWLALLLVTLLASGLRFGNISDVGIRFDDESAYVSDATLWHRCASLLVGTETGGIPTSEGKYAVQRQLKEAGIDFRARYAKPCQGYTFVGALMMFVVGEGPLGLIVFNAICGTLTVVLLYLWSSLLFGRAVALTAAFLLAVSPYHLAYCRSTFPIAPATLSILLAVYLWTLGHRRRLQARTANLFTGLAIGYAITCHFSVAYIVPVLAAFDYAMARRRKARDGDGGLAPASCPLVTRWAYAVGGIAAPIVAIDLVFRAAQLVAWGTDSYLPLVSYFKALTHWAGVVMRANMPGTDLAVWQIPVTYAQYFTTWHGAAAGLVLIGGVCVLIRRRGIARLPAIMVCVVVLILTIQHYTMLRSFAPIAPFACVCSAVGVLALAAQLRLRRRILHATQIALVVLLTLPAGLQAGQIYQRHSGIEDAWRFIERNEGGVVAVPFDTCYGSKYATYWTRQSNATILRNHMDNLLPRWTVDQLRARGVRWVITDPQHWHTYRNNHKDKGTCFQSWMNFERELLRDATLAASFAHMTAGRWQFLAEAVGLRALADMSKHDAGGIRVFELSTPPARTSFAARNPSAGS